MINKHVMLHPSTMRKLGWRNIENELPPEEVTVLISDRVHVERAFMVYAEHRQSNQYTWFDRDSIFRLRGEKLHPVIKNHWRYKWWKYAN